MVDKEFKIGDEVILGRHQKINGVDYTDCWESRMEAYVGKKAKIVSHYGIDEWGCNCYYIDLDKCRFYWRAINMTDINSNNTATNATTTNSGAKCIRCHDFFPYAEVSETFKCFGCKH